MATDQATIPVNGTYGTAPSNPYSSQDQTLASHQPSQTASAGPPGLNSANPAAIQHSPSSGTQEIPKEEVAWYFVEQYYTTLSRSPDRLYLFFNKRSQFVSGQEDEKVPVCAGQKAIKERIADLEFKDAKVRVTNVDSQASDSNIVIQVIGELSNDSEPHRKFVQTFVLAGQTNGYFVLNDIFRYIKDEDEQPETDELQQEPVVTAGGFQEPAPTAEDSGVKGLVSSKDSVVQEQAAAQIDKELDEIIQQQEEEAKEEDSPAGVNGSPVSEEVDFTPAGEAPAAEVTIEEQPKAELTASAVAVPELDPEMPKDPASTTAAAPKPSTKPAVPTGPPKPAVPKTWARVAGGKGSSAAPPSAALAPAVSQPKQTQPAPVLPSASQLPAPAAASAPPPREPSPAEGSQEGSQGGWQTAGPDHSRKQSRSQTQQPANDNGKTRAYVKNVYPTVDANELKAHLAKFGELAYFDVSRQKNSAFAEFNTRAGFDAAVAANPHKFGNDNIYVEERRTMQGQAGQRGSFRGGPGRPYEQRGRGGFGGPRGRGGNITPRGGRPTAAQGA